jgi:hypothetical protein
LGDGIEVRRRGCKQLSGWVHSTATPETTATHLDVVVSLSTTKYTACRNECVRVRTLEVHGMQGRPHKHLAHVQVRGGVAEGWLCVLRWAGGWGCLGGVRVLGCPNDCPAHVQVRASVVKGRGCASGC